MSMTLTLGGANLTVAVVQPAPAAPVAPAAPKLTVDAYGFTVNSVISLFIYIDDKAIARIVGSTHSKTFNGKTHYVLRCVKHTMVDGKPTTFTMCEYGPINELVALDATTWNGKPALKAVALEDVACFKSAQLDCLLNAGQVMNRLGYRKAPASKRVRRVCGR